MKNHRFLWLRNRTTDNRKCEKARNIKEKRTIEMFKPVFYDRFFYRTEFRKGQLFVLLHGGVCILPCREGQSCRSFRTGCRVVFQD